MELPVRPFDWQRLFFGDQPPLYLLEIVFRVVVLYIMAVAIFTFSGKRERRQLSSFDLVLLIAVGSVLGDVLFYPDVPLIYALIVPLLAVGLQQLTARLEVRWPGLHRLTEGSARLVIRDGRIIDRALAAEGLTREELFSMLREQGIEHTGCISRAYLELSGDLGVIRAASESSSLQPHSGQSTLQTVRDD